MKTTNEMNLEEFADWATGKILIGLGAGESLRSLVTGILICIPNNEIIGGYKYLKAAQRYKKLKSQFEMISDTQWDCSRFIIGKDFDKAVDKIKES